MSCQIVPFVVTLDDLEGDSFPYCKPFVYDFCYSYAAVDKP